jgi:hypothetical protein
MNDPKIVLTPTQIGELVKAANAPSPTVFQKVLLRSFKMSGEEVRKLSQMFGLVQSIIGAYGTIKAFLDFTGLLKPDDPFKDIKDLIEAKFLELKDYYQDEEDEKRFERGEFNFARQRNRQRGFGRYEKSRGDILHQG